MTRTKTNYLNNKDLLLEIHRSKNRYSYFTDPKYHDYDCIVEDIEEITPELIRFVKETKAKKMVQAEKQRLKESGLKTHQIKVADVDPTSIDDEDLVWRVMTFDHIPLEPGRVKNPKSVSDNHVKVNFLPFKHFVFENGSLKEVGRSHWKDALENGEFSKDHGQITNRLALSYMKLVERYSQRGNWRGYTYNDEMRSQALMQLSIMGLQFNEARSDNPFAYYTVAVQNAFTRVLNVEKRNQNIRDDLLIMSGVSPSMTRQIEDSMAQKIEAGTVAPANKMTRKASPSKAAISAADADTETED